MTRLPFWKQTVFASPLARMHPDVRLLRLAKGGFRVGGNDNIVIRPVEQADEAEWRRLWTAYLEFYESTLPESVYASTFARLLGDDAQDFNGLIAEVDGQAKGLTHYLFHRHCWRIENTCYLQDLYVDPDTRGTGLGRKLIEAVYAAADAQGAGSVYWLTQEFNNTARLLYDRIATKTDFVHYSSQRGS